METWEAPPRGWRAPPKLFLLFVFVFNLCSPELSFVPQRMHFWGIWGSFWCAELSLVTVGPQSIWEPKAHLFQPCHGSEPTQPGLGCFQGSRGSHQTTEKSNGIMQPGNIVPFSAGHCCAGSSVAWGCSSPS